jgi:hypothetical protein
MGIRLSPAGPPLPWSPSRTFPPHRGVRKGSRGYRRIPPAGALFSVSIAQRLCYPAGLRGCMPRLGRLRASRMAPNGREHP